MLKLLATQPDIFDLLFHQCFILTLFFQIFAAKGDTKICDTLECPADCGTVRISTQENCAYCQCGPELAPGDVEVSIYQECPPNTLPGPTQLVTKVCRAPTREGETHLPTEC